MASKSNQCLAVRYLAHSSFQVFLAFQFDLSFKEGRDVVLCGLFGVNLSISVNCRYMYFYIILISNCVCSSYMKTVCRERGCANLKGHSTKTSMSFES
jgi:hypothetical protein